MRLILAVRAFFRILFEKQTAEQVERLLLAGPSPEKPVPSSKTEPAKAPPAASKPQRNDALTLLATLQREARFIDFLKEPLEGFSDAQVGAVARDVHRDCGRVIERWFGVIPLSDQQEGATVELPAGFDAGQYRLTGQVAGEPPYRGRIVHPGWKATRAETPTWTGSEAAARVIAPTEVEV